MEIILTASFSQDNKLIFQNQTDLERYGIESKGQDLTVRISPKVNQQEKQRMIKYLFGPLLDVAIVGYYQQGWNGIDKVKAIYMLKSEFAKGTDFNDKTGEQLVFLEDISAMTKDRLLRFINDCIFFLETDLEVTVPDSAEYKAMRDTGRRYKSVKYDKK